MTMGYKRKRKIYKLQFEGTEQDGLEVRVRGLTIGELDSIADAEEKDTRGRRHLQELLARQIVDWNMEDEDGTPMPSTLDSILSLELGDFWGIINAWAGAVSGVAGPLPQTSSDGPTVLEAQIPMETLSASLAS